MWARVETQRTERRYPPYAVDLWPRANGKSPGAALDNQDLDA